MGKDIFLFDSIPLRLVTERLMQLAIRNEDIFGESVTLKGGQGFKRVIRDTLEANRGTWGKNRERRANKGYL